MDSLSVLYGSENVNIDLTSDFMIIDNILLIPKNLDLNKIRGDPLPGLPKKLFIKTKDRKFEISEKNGHMVDNLLKILIGYFI